MRAIFLYTLSGFIILVTNACNGLLNQQPKTLSSSSAFSTPEGAYKELIGTYQRTMPNASNGYYWAFGDITSDDAVKGGSGPGDQARILKLEYFTVNASNTALSPIWRNNYQGIHRANLVIENVPEVDGLDQSKAAKYIAEAKFLRSFFYYRLVKIFGGVPLIKKANLENYEVTRSSKDSTYNLIEADLKDAVSVLPPNSKLTNDQIGRATKGAALALLTRVYLMQGDFPETEKWARKIIDSGEYSMDPDYSHIFSIDGDHGSGAIYSINYAYNPKYAMATADDIYRHSRAYGGYGFELPTQDLYDAFASNDPRLKATMYMNGDILSDGRIGDVGNSSTGYINNKAYIPEDEFHPGGTGRDNKIFRLAEIYLWYAEAANENGNTKEALNALNKVIERARKGDSNILPDITVTDKETLRKKIWHEERVEYALESKRFYDLVRTGRAAKILHAYAEKYNTKKGENFKKNVNNIFPIPQSQIELSSGTLKQNPGY